MNFLESNWAVEILGGVVVLALAGLAKTVHSRWATTKKAPPSELAPFKFKVAEEEVGFEEKLRSVQMDVVKVIAHDHLVGIQAEYAWVKHNYPGSRQKSQSLIDEVFVFGKKKQVVTFDLIELELQDGRSKDVYFDISSFMGSDTPSSVVNLEEHKKQKLKEACSTKT